jgi:glycosyltransferase involved in cell wall biosynthesis
VECRVPEEDTDVNAPQDMQVAGRRLAVVVPTLQGGGCERIVSAILPALSESYEVDLILHEHRIAYPVPDGVTVKCLGVDTGTGLSLGAKAARMRERVRAVRKHLQTGAYNAIVSFLDLNNTVVYWANRGPGPHLPHLAVEQTLCPGFFRFNPTARRWRLPLRLLLTHTYRRVRTLVVLSRTMRAFLWRDLHVRRRMYVIHNGVDTARFERPQKDQLWLLERMPEILAAQPEAQLFLIGSGPDEEALRREVTTRGLVEKVHFLGWCDRVEAYLRAAHVLVHCARYETFGNVLIESLACGTPVVVRDTDPVFSEILADGDLGMLVPPDDHRLYVQRIGHVLGRSAAAPEVDLAISRHVRTAYAMDETIKQYLTAVQRLLIP